MSSSGDVLTHIVSLLHLLNVQKSVEATCSVVRSRESIPHRHGRDGVIRLLKTRLKTVLLHSPCSAFSEFSGSLSSEWPRRRMQRSMRRDWLLRRNDTPYFQVVLVTFVSKTEPTKHPYTFPFASSGGEGDQSKTDGKVNVNRLLRVCGEPAQESCEMTKNRSFIQSPRVRCEEVVCSLSCAVV